VREECLVRFVSVTKEVVNPIEEPGEPLSIQPGGHIALGEAFTQRVIGLTLCGFPPVSPENAEVTAIKEAQNHGTDGPDHLDKGRQGGAPSRPFR
jgi:hypothetical protein